VRGFERITLRIAQLRADLDEFEAFLNSATHLKEREHIAPFFKARKHLVAALGFTHSGIAFPDRVSTELDLFGDFACDVASGDSVSKAFLLVEFENAEERSVLERAPAPGKIKPWSRRFEHGFSQLIDWAWRLSCEPHNSHAFRRIFEVNDPAIHFLLIAGRDADLTEDDRARIHWRANNMNLGAYRMSCLTFDGVLSTLRRRLTYLEQ
jgi:hypothetical protein